MPVLRASLQISRDHYLAPCQMTQVPPTTIQSSPITSLALPVHRGVGGYIPGLLDSTGPRALGPWTATALLFVLVGFRSGLEASYFQSVTKTGSINCLPKSSILLKIVVPTLAPLRVPEAELHYSKEFLAIWDRMLNKSGFPSL